MTEKELWVKLRGAAKAVSIVPERYENAAGFGTFDVSLSWTNHTVWIELKASVNAILRISQMHWARARQEAGCLDDMHILFPHKGGIYLLDAFYPLENGGQLKLEHAMVFPSMDSMLLTLKGKWRPL